MVDYCSGGGVATVCATDIFVAASISNWGMYGVAAMLAFLVEDVNIMHDEETERRMIAIMKLMIEIALPEDDSEVGA